MKKTNLKLSSYDFPMVNSLDNLEVGKIYQTTNYDMLKSLKFNRGVEEGFLPERVQAITKMIDNGTFMYGVAHVLVNLCGVAIDGGNRKIGLKLRNKPVNFIITAEPRFNLDDESEILNNVSELNSINPVWFDNDAYKSALGYDEPTAVAIKDLKKVIADSETFAGLEDLFTPSRVIVLATKDKTGLSSKKQSRRVYCSHDIAQTIKSDDFKKLVDFTCNVLNFVAVNNPSITPWFVIRQLMPHIWKYDLSLNVLLSNLTKRGFVGIDTKMAGIKDRVDYIVRMANVR